MTDRQTKRPVEHQPTKAEMEEVIEIDATPKALAWAMTRGGADRREPDDESDEAA
ncbi:MAG: hypothetical protein OXO52_12585 [Rhodospirillales bacterium]|nr:hypothetical protein [Rhodospirillales bacterium]MDE0380870.1 hypothetical protein [Rhodospirillales bacterium]